MIRIALCDDDPAIRQTLAGYLARFARENAIELEWREFPDGSRLLASAPETFDLLILDVEMGQTNGIDTARELRKRGVTSTIIFFTNFVQYALEGYEVQAYRFILKPPDYGQFSQVAGQVLTRIQREKGDFLSVRLREGISRLPVADLIYAETERGHVLLHIRNRPDLITFSTMKELESALAGHLFFRCHTAYLVSLKEIRSVGKQDICLESGVTLPVSKHRKKELTEALTVYWGDQFL